MRTHTSLTNHAAGHSRGEARIIVASLSPSSPTVSSTWYCARATAIPAAATATATSLRDACGVCGAWKPAEAAPRRR